MNKIILGAVIAVIAGSAFAGTLVDPVMNQTVIAQETATSGFNHHVIPPLFFLFFVGLGLIL